ncbi:hypothetical protein ACFQ5H_19185 [Robinsoniella peoriensis]|uniref:hypothetical protein n=1 Tax=Robinsoniella peoriensis TaxID=180332 RepID=UPI00363B08D2
MAGGTETPLVYTQDEAGFHITLPETQDSIGACWSVWCAGSGCQCFGGISPPSW